MMQPAFGSSYDQLMVQIRNHVRAQIINEEIFKLLQSATGKALAAQNVVLSQPEKDRLFHSVMKEVLTDVLRKIE